jgi:imidazoleglycerol-phosphate dehydratase
MNMRFGSVTRETNETNVTSEIRIDGKGISKVNTGIGMLDHLLELFAKHGRFDIKVEAEGDLEVDEHHTVEDVAITLGRAFNKALGERKGIVRMGHALVSMDETLALVAVDIGGRSYAKIDADFSREFIGKLPTELISHFLESFAAEARLNLHVKVLYGVNNHHKAEAIFKALGRALDDATKTDERLKGEVPSTKGVI